MGMFDNIHVKANNINLPLPKDGYYQTKWLDSNLCEIQMDADGQMTCPDFRGCEMYPVDDVESLHYGNYDEDEFWFHGDDINGRWHEFKATVVNSRIVKLWSYGDLLFDADATDDEEFDNLPDNWELQAGQVTSVTLVRHKKLKGSRRYATRSHRTVKCNVPIYPDGQGFFSIAIDVPELKATLYGIMTEDSLSMHASEIEELRHSYLKKGFRTIVGYNTQFNKTNIG